MAMLNLPEGYLFRLRPTPRHRAAPRRRAPTRGRRCGPPGDDWP